MPEQQKQRDQADDSTRTVVEQARALAEEAIRDAREVGGIFAEGLAHRSGHSPVMVPTRQDALRPWSTSRRVSAALNEDTIAWKLPALM
jgi:hypothetical protein